MRPPPAPERRTTRRDRGSTSLTAVLLTPVFVVIAFAAFQAAMWSHARTEARVIAREVAVLVAQRSEDADLIADSAAANLDRTETMRDASVSVTVEGAAGGSVVVVRITGSAPGIVRGTSTGVDVTEAVPLEGFRP